MLWYAHCATDICKFLEFSCVSEFYCQSTLTAITKKRSELTFCMLETVSIRWHDETPFSYFRQKLVVEISCKLSPKRAICVKCQKLEKIEDITEHSQKAHIKGSSTINDNEKQRWIEIWRYYRTRTGKQYEYKPSHDKIYNKICVTSKDRSACTSTQ